MKRLKTAFTLLMLLGSVGSHAQTQTLSGFTSFNKKAITPIYERNEVKGYTMVYRTEKAESKSDIYGLDFFDENLQKVGSVVLPKERYNSHLIRRASNGETFSFYFYNSRSKRLEIDVFDKALNKVASRQFAGLTKADQDVALQEMHVACNGGSKLISGLNLYAVPEKGYVRNGYTGKMKGFSLEMYDNNLEQIWAYSSEDTSKAYESLLVNEVTDKYILATITRKPGKSSKQLDFFVAAFDIETGQKVLDVAVEKDQTQQLAVSSFSFDDSKGELIIMGEYYSPEDIEMEGKSMGFFLKRIDLDGKELSEKLFAWDKDVNPLLPQEAQKSLEEGFISFVHKIVRGADGRQHIVAEQYKLKADGVGIALSVLGGGTSTIKGVIGNMMIYTLGADLNLEKISFYKKDQTDCILPPGTGAYGAGLAGLVINMNGGFDYQFTQEENSQSGFNTTFINYRQVKNSKFREKTLVNITYADNNEQVTDKIDVTNRYDVVSYVYPAKPGYVLVLGSQPEEEKLEMKLVKLDKQYLQQSLRAQQ
ncbi:DUF6770 family protein [Pontibacter toksunensis]|uniref:DUF6770 family protein n=1 Tax=Pontibacter toksunensis TaxID=1332631 RepID=A0ABW6C0J8_9BACT